jgi:fluoroacetyl-CoA thioesterase
MEIRRVVTLADTAAAWDESLPPAASTPFVLGLAELACHAILAPDLAEDELSVGTGATIEHLGASRVGATLVARAETRTRDGGRATFAVEVHDGPRLVARVEHGRAVVARARILAALEAA